MALTKVGKEGITGISNSSDATAITIDSSEKVGIGETSPLGTLHVRTSDASITSVNANADDFIVENNGNCGISICSSTSGQGNINFIDSGDTNVGRINYSHDTNNMIFRVNDSEAMRISSDGEITKPSQPAFLAQPASNQEDITAGQNITVVLGTEVFDVGSNFASNTFTAPVTGKYLLIFTLYGSQLDGDASYMEIAIETSNRTYTTIQEPSGTEDVYAGGTTAAVADMDANDTAFVRVTTGSGQSTFDVTTSSRFSGALIC